MQPREIALHRRSLLRGERGFCSEDTKSSVSCKKDGENGSKMDKRRGGERL